MKYLQAHIPVLALPIPLFHTVQTDLPFPFLTKYERLLPR